MTKFFVVAAALITLLVALANCLNSKSLTKNSVGKSCANDTNCGVNEVCHLDGDIAPACQFGTCQCKPCFGIAYPEEPCTHVKLRKPCDSKCSLRQCDASCDQQSSGEVYPPNSLCRNSYWPGYDVVTCDNCYNFMYGTCVRQPKATAPRGSDCSIDCDCAATTTCLGQCRCPVGSTWNVAEKSCLPLLFGDKCTSDADCRDDSFAFQGVCSNGKCGCKNQFQQVSKLVEVAGNWSISTSTVCVDSNIKVKEVKEDNNDTCTLGAFDGGQQSVKLCSAGHVCFQCPTNETASQPTCKSLDVKNAGSINGNCSYSLKTSKFSQVCGHDADCGTNEFCHFMPVQPACSYGVCACLSCATALTLGNDTVCKPVQRLRLGDNCTFSATELYPNNARCLAVDDEGNFTVTCESSHILRGAECVPRIVGAGIDALCRVYSGDCAASLECQGPAKCDCPGTNGYWDAATKTCRRRSAGDSCRQDSDCNDATSPTSGYICKSGKCTCDPRFAAGQVKCASEKTANTCLRCPEDNSTSPCRSKNATMATSFTKPLQCFEENDTFSMTCSAPAKPTLGRWCYTDDQCGKNEECMSPSFKPSCFSKQCQCKPCHDRNSQGICAPVVRVKLGNSCSNADNELHGKELSCVNGTIDCSECYSNVNGTCSWRPIGKKPGDSCRRDCDCATRKCSPNPANETSSLICTCPHRFMRWSDERRECVLREYGDSCQSDIDCQADGKQDKGYSRRSGAACVNGTCGCGRGYATTTVTLLVDDDRDWSSNATNASNKTLLVDKKICVLRSASKYLNTKLGGACALDPIYHSSDRDMLSMGVCGRGLVCLKCVDDFGACRQVNETLLIESGTKLGCHPSLIGSTNSPHIVVSSP